MYIINTTFIVMPTVHGNWYKFMTEKFVESIANDDKFGSLRFTRLLSEDVEKHFTYSLQIDCKDMSVYKYYMEDRLVEYSEFSSSLFDAEVMHFVSLLKIIEERKK